MRLAASAVGDLASAKLGNQRRMAGKNAEVPIEPGNLDGLRVVADDHLLGSYDFELEEISHWSFVVGRNSDSALASGSDSKRQTAEVFGQRRITNDQRRFYAAAFIFSAASCTSSIVPFM